MRPKNEQKMKGDCTSAGKALGYLWSYPGRCTVVSQPGSCPFSSGVAGGLLETL